MLMSKRMVDRCQCPWGILIGACVSKVGYEVSVSQGVDVTCLIPEGHELS